MVFHSRPIFLMTKKIHLRPKPHSEDMEDSETKRENFR